MKVEKISSNSIKTSAIKQKPNTTGSSFTGLMKEKKDEETKRQLDDMMKNIKEKGKELVESKNLDILVSYKKMIKDFVTSAVEFAFEIVDVKGRSRIGRSKVLKIISQIDENLLEITNEFLNEERSNLNLLKKIGELGGLLTDIYI